MTRSGHRAVLVALGVLAVALGSALFPPAGFGSAPAGETDLVDAGGAAAGEPTDEPAGSSSTAVPATADGTPVDVTDDGRTTSTPSVVTARSRATDTPGATATQTPTATATATQTPTPESVDDTEADGQLLYGLLGAVALACLALATIAGLHVTGWSNRRRGSSSLGWLPIWGLLGQLSGVSPTTVATRIPQMTMVALVGVSTGTARVLGSAGSVAGQALSGLGTVLHLGSRSATTGLFTGISGLFSLPSGQLFSLSGAFSGLSTGGSGGATGNSPATDARSAADVDPEQGDGTVIRTVEGAWEAFAEPLPVADPEARTPGEFARLAVERGDPAGPVRRLRDVFRDVRYGGRPATEDRTRSAVEAVTDILATREEEDDG